MRVKIIHSHNDIKLVEWVEDGNVYRAWTTPDMIESVEGQQAEVSHPDRGIPYGEDWSELISRSVNPDEVEMSLKNSGIWTFEDLQTRPNEVHGAIMAVAAVVIRDLFVNVKLQRSLQNGS